MYDLHDFLSPINIHSLNDDQGYNDGQLAKHISINDGEIPSLDGIDIVLVGVNESGGSGVSGNYNDAADMIRKQFFQLHYWHNDVTIADIGNIKTGATLQDSYAAISTVVAELISMKKTVVLLGGTHDISLPQYFAYKKLDKIVEATCIDATIDLKGESALRSENFLLEMLTG